MTPTEGANRTRLSGWKAIAQHMGCDESTVRRWYKDEGMPVHKASNSSKAPVFAFVDELDAWIAARSVQREAKPLADPVSSPTPTSLQQSVRSRVRRPWAIATIVLFLATVVVFAIVAFPRIWSPLPAPIRLGRILARATSENGRLVQIKTPVPISQFVAAPDGSHGYAFRTHGTVVFRLSIPDGAAETINLESSIVDLEISPDSYTLYIATPQGITIFDLRSRSRRNVALGGTVYDIVLAPSGKVIYAAMGQRGIHKIDTRTGASAIVTKQPAPFYLTIDPSGRTLFVSYQNGGIGGRDGHDTVEAFDLETGVTITTSPGPPLVGGPPAYSHATKQLWAQMWNACYGEAFDQLDCPFVPSTGFQVFRGNDLRLVKTVAFAVRHTERAHFPADGSLAIVSGHTLKVLDSATFHVLEELKLPITAAATSSRDGKRLFVPTEHLIYIFEPPPAECFQPPAPLAQHFAFDGSLEDATETTSFRPSGDFRFVPGRIGQALRLANGAAMRMKSPSESRLGDPQGPAESLVFWFRAHKPSMLLSRESFIPWSLEWSGGKLLLKSANDLELSADAPTERWHHIALIHAKGNFELFLNGTSVASGNTSLRRSDLPTADFQAHGDFDLDELMTFGVRLTPEMIKTIAAIGPDGNCGH